MTREDQIKKASEIIAYGCSDELEAALIKDFPELKESENKSFIEIPFGAKDSELCGWEYTIPEDMEAEIRDGKVIVKKKESEDEKIRRKLIDFFSGYKADEDWWGDITEKDILAYLEKQKEQKPAEWSEEDENKLGDLICYFEGDALDCSTEDMIRWLKSLRPQSHWKPSEEQMAALKEASTSFMNETMGNSELLCSLYNDLKKL